MPIFVSPKGNFEVWDIMPTGYFTVEEWKISHPPVLPTQEELYNQERKAVDKKYSASWDGNTGGILTLIQMTMTSALSEVPQDATKIGKIGSQYQIQLRNMYNELNAIDSKYGVV